MLERQKTLIMLIVSAQLVLPLKNYSVQNILPSQAADSVV